MEIRGSLHSNWLPTPANQRSAQEQRVDEKERQAERPTEPGPLREYISRGDVVQGQGNADYREALARARQGRDTPAEGSVNNSTSTSRKAQQALDAYQSNASAVDSGGVELLPRVDGYA